MKFKSILVGYGYWGPNLARNIHQDPGYELMGIVETNEARAILASRTYMLPIARFLSDIPNIENIEIAFIATKPSTHFELAKFFIMKGIHVVIPKPVTTSLADAQKLEELAKKFNVNVYCDYTYIHSDNFKYMKDWAKKNQLTSYTSYRCSLGILQSDVDVIADLASHDFSMLYKLTGELPSQIRCLDTSSFYHLNNATSASIFAKWSNGFTATIHVSWSSPKKLRKLILSSEKSSLLIDETNVLQQVSEISFNDNNLESFELDTEYRRNVSFTVGEERFINLDRNESLAKELHDIHAHLSKSQLDANVVSIRDAIEIWKFLENSKATMTGDKLDTI